MVSELDDILVLELLEDLDLLAKAVHILPIFAFTGDELQSDKLVGISVDGSVDLPEWALADQVLNLILANFLHFHI